MTYGWIMKSLAIGQTSYETNPGWPAHPATATHRGGKRRSPTAPLFVHFALNTEDLADYGVTRDRPASGNAERVPVT